MDRRACKPRARRRTDERASKTSPNSWLQIAIRARLDLRQGVFKNTSVPLFACPMGAGLWQHPAANRVMRGLDPRIHVFAENEQVVDGRDKPGHDEDFGWSPCHDRPALLDH